MFTFCSLSASRKTSPPGIAHRNFCAGGKGKEKRDITHPKISFCKESLRGEGIVKDINDERAILGFTEKITHNGERLSQVLYKIIKWVGIAQKVPF